MPSPSVPERIELAPGLVVARLVTGLWQVADMEKDGGDLDPETAADAMAVYAADGFDTFDMADHYGSAEVITGALLRRTLPGSDSRPVAFTKWCPEPGAMSREVVRAGVRRSMDRLGVDAIDLLQFHWWSFDHLAYVDALHELTALCREGWIRHVGVTNFDTDHLRVAVGEGVPVVSNQVSFSVLDRRAAADMTAFCLTHGIRLLAYGTLAGGLLSERWLGQPDPAETIHDWSKMKYRRFVEAVGGWKVFQQALAVLDSVARKHGASIANVATRWVLDQPAVAGVIVGARLGESEHRSDNARLFALHLDAADRAAIDALASRLTPIPGDCGDEYRHPPFLTASGDLSHHLGAARNYFTAVPDPNQPRRLRVDSGSPWESVGGYSRAVRIGDRILVSGTTATHGQAAVCKGDAVGQAVYILDKIAASIAALGGGLDDVVRSRIYLRDAAQWEPVARVHGHYFGRARPANTLIGVSRLVGDYEVEIEVEAVLASGAVP
jgi:aryl-alcohol dehydrogenase-like predicted oxidoreductase/enamine deaminase RidA (YjgF/YER057c/UK114 family)